ncbi:MAG: hypothetical protein WKF45_04045 [Ilumatobacteraceae bacterium]
MRIGRAMGGVILVLASLLAPAVAGDATAQPDPPDTVPIATSDDGRGLDEQYLESEQFDDCVNLLPRPDCGSERRGGWRQAALFGVIVLALAVIGWRITRAVRR